MSSTCPSAGVISPCFTRLTAGQAVGLALNVEAGLISSLAVIIFLSLVVRNVIRNYRNPPPGGWSLLRTHIDTYILFLLLFEITHGLASAMSIKWLHEGELYCSKYCTVQGAMLNAGSTGVAFVMSVIAIHTFLVIFFKWTPPRSLFIPLTVLFSISAFILTYLLYELLVSRPPDQPFFAPSPYWCWIGPHHPAARIWAEYLWLWITAFMSIILYVPLYFCVKGNLSYHPDSHWKVVISRKSIRRNSGASVQTHAGQGATMDAMCMLYYPVAYALLVLPNSIVRFMSESWDAQGKQLPFAPNITGNALLALSGLVNVILFMTTRPNLLLFHSSPHPTLPSQPSKVRVARLPCSNSETWQWHEAYTLPSTSGSTSTAHSIETLIINPRQSPPSCDWEREGR